VTADEASIAIEDGDLVARVGGRIVFASPAQRVQAIRVDPPSVWTHPAATIWYGAMAILPISVAVLVILNTEAWFGRGMAQWKPFVAALGIGFAVVGLAGAMLLRSLSRRLGRSTRRVVIVAGERRYGFEIARENEQKVRRSIEAMGLGAEDESNRP